MDLIVGDVIFAIFAVVGLCVIVRSAVCALLRRFGATASSGVRRRVVCVWIADDAEHAEAALRDLTRAPSGVPTDYVVVLEGLGAETRRICRLFARDCGNVRTAETAAECFT